LAKVSVAAGSSDSATVREELLELLCCPICRSALATISTDSVVAALRCSGCGRQYAVVGGIPRFAETPKDETVKRTQASFGYEWTHFADWQQSGSTNFNDYFEGVDLDALKDAIVLDAGCGMGRHARCIAPHVRRVVAVDFSGAIDQAARNVADCPNVDCIQADITALPLVDGAFDFVYSLGVLHHIDDTAGAIAALVRKLRRGGRLRVYLYWQRHGWKGRLLHAVSTVRRLTVRLPFPMLRIFCWALSVALYVGVIAPYRVLTAIGLTGHEQWPLSVYTKYPFYILYNDQFDRFSAPIEKRYTAEQARNLFVAAGLNDVRVIERYGWVVEGRKE
jgi:SAM-dependent methyltransferase